MKKKKTQKVAQKLKKTPKKFVYLTHQQGGK